MESQALYSTIRSGDRQGNLKWCKYCSQWKDRSEFTRRSLSKDGLSYKCRLCGHAYSARRYREDPECKERAKARARRWAQGNPIRRKEIRTRSAEKYREQKNAQTREYNKRIRKLFPEKARLKGRIAAHRRRVRESANGDFPPRKVVQMIIDMARARCVYCGRTDRPLTLDHFDPVINGGSNEWDNLVPCCKSCNSSKNRKDGADWLYECHGVNGLADAIVFFKSVAKAIKRLYPELHKKILAK